MMGGISISKSPDRLRLASANQATAEIISTPAITKISSIFCEIFRFPACIVFYSSCTVRSKHMCRSVVPMM